MKYLITGGAGFIGSHIVEHLIERDGEVRVLDNFATGKIANLDGVADKTKVELMQGSLTNERTVRKSVEGIDIILHQGALPSVALSHKMPGEFTDVNIRGTLNLLMAARDEDVKRVVIASSASVYGDNGDILTALPKTESMNTNPRSIYAATKLACEHYAAIFGSVFGLSTICLRYFNIFGERQNTKLEYASAIPKFIKLMLSGKQPTIYGDGEQTRDFTYVDNVVKANMLAATTQGIETGFVCNIGCGDSISILRLVETINKILGTDIQPKFDDPRLGDVKHSHADISLARSVLNYEPAVDFEEGLRKTIEYIRRSN